MQLHAEFLQTDAGRVFVVAREVAGASATVLVVPPFAEEMNKSRRMLTEACLALAARGVSSVAVDLYGTGDSEGEFADASVARWLDSLKGLIGWSAARGMPITRLLGVRLGCLLAAELVKASGLDVARTVFWQPVVEGSRMLDQFLRLRVAAQMMDAGNKESVADLRKRLHDEAIEVAGYDLSPQLVAGIDTLRLADIDGPRLGQLHWLEILRAADTPMPVGSTRAIESLKNSGCNVATQAVICEPFWLSTEIVTSAALVDATVKAFCEAA
jgi:exosortase A-associated hydrolase 2